MTDTQLFMLLLLLNLIITILHLFVIKYDLQTRLDIVKIEKELSESNLKISKDIVDYGKKLCDIFKPKK